MKEKYILYGVNRVSKDFIYMFDDLIHIVGVIDEEYSETIFLGKRVYDWQVIDKNTKLIICDFDKTDKKEKLLLKGLRYGVDFFYEEDFFYLLDDWEIPQNKHIAIWGMGRIGHRFLENHSELEIEYIVDKNADILENTIAPQEITKIDNLFIIITTVKWKEVAELLSRMGYVEKKDYITFFQYENKPSEMLRRTIFDRSSYDFECNTMLNHLEILNGGITACCCTTFLDSRLGSVFNNSSEDIWKSNIHKVLCLSVENKTYSFCKKDMCPFFLGKKNNNEVDHNLTNPYKEMKDNPEVIVAAYDSTCNLHCITCRKGVKIADGKEKSDNQYIAKYISNNYLKNCKLLVMAGDGEVFLSKEYEDVYTNKQCNEIPYIRLLSNGTLFTKDRWEKFYEGKQGKVFLTVSIDAASKKTYESIRCGGNFDRLRDNMLFASKLRKKGDLAYFRINFVVQKNNYEEMIDFINWGVELGCDEVFFTKILNWGTYSEEEFKEISMMEEDGMSPKKELVSVLKNPVFNNPIVDMGTILAFGKEVKEKNIDNYYMWELERHGKS